MVLAGLSAIIFLYSFRPQTIYNSTYIVPPEPDYSDPSQWYIRDRGACADIFYIISTETGSHLEYGDTCHFADT